MLDPPFLELEFYVGSASLNAALQQLAVEVASAIGPIKVGIPRAVGLSDNEELEVIGGVVLLRTEGELFCGSSRDDLGRLRMLGHRVYHRFVEVADAIPSVYGAILVEYSLEEPEVLRKDHRSLAFRDFFLSSEHLDSTAIDEAVRLAGSDAYVERRARGIYISMSEEFNPKGSSVPSIQAQERSARISAIVGRATP